MYAGDEFYDDDVTSGPVGEYRKALDREHAHREYGYFGWMGKGDFAYRRVGREGCRVCELIGRPIHVHDEPGAYVIGGACLGWAEDGD